MSNEKHCLVCGRENSEDDYKDHDGMFWECWDDHLTEESDTLFGELMQLSDEELVCLRCGREITKTQYDDYDGYCEECYAIEDDELDNEEGY